MADRVRPYLPRLVIDWLSTEPERRSREVTGSLVFVDVSGFTRLSERLARQGRIGAEQLTDLIGSCFTRLLAAAYANGGGLLKFGGDALLLLFNGSGHELRACRAAAGMRRELSSIGALEVERSRVRLKMSVGIHSGTFQCSLIGGIHREFIICGPDVSRVVEMEARAEAGQILLSRDTARALPSSAVTPVDHDAFLLRRQPGGLSTSPIELLPDHGSASLREGLPSAIAERVLAGVDDPEHKRVTIAFLHFDGVDAMVRDVGSAELSSGLNALVCTVQQAVERYGVCFLGTDIDRDGGKIILIAGAPTATGDEESRMLHALREIFDTPGLLPIRAGVNVGHVFVGDVGPSYRRTYTVMGDAVNLTARLMAKADPGQILASEDLLRAVGSGFVAVPLEPFLVKGKSAPVQAYAVGSPVDATDDVGARAVPLVGREAEVALLISRAKSARAGRGHVVEVVGDAGIGKSRLVAELRDLGDYLAVEFVRCDPFHANTPYFAARRLLDGVLGPLCNERTASAILRVLQDRAPELIPWSPLIGDVLELEMPLTSTVSELKGEFRRARTAEVVVDLLIALLVDPTVVVVEDTQWMDEASADVLLRLIDAAAERPWLLCLSRRPGPAGLNPQPGSQLERLDLGPLGEGPSRSLLQILTEDAPLAPHEVAALIERSGGNPLFLSELVLVSRDAESIEDLPGTVEAVVAARIDQLAPADRRLLRSLSVLGTRFPRTLAEAVLPEPPPSRSESWRRLRDFLAMDEAGWVVFTQALVRDVAYGGLPYRARRRLHGRAGDAILADLGDTVDDKAGALSTHFYHAARYQEAWRYSISAADRARAVYANTDAVEFYERALAASRRLVDMPTGDVAAIWQQLGDVRRRLGDYPAAIEAYRRARRLVPDDPVAVAALMLKQGRVFEVASRYADAVRWLRRARQVLGTNSSSAAVAQRAQLAVAFAAVRLHEGKPDSVVKWCGVALEEATAAGDRDALAHAYYLLDAAYVALGRREEANYSGRALAIYEELEDLWGQGVVLNNLGAYAYWQGEWDEAVAYYQRGRDARERIGDAVNASYGTVNIAEILLNQGRLDEAEPLLRDVLRVWRAAKDRASVAYAQSLLGRLMVRQGDIEQGRQLLATAEQTFAHVGRHADVVEAHAFLAESWLWQGEADRARAELDSAIELARTTGGANVHVPMLHRLCGYTYLQVGDAPAAADELSTSLEGARTRSADYEVALTLRPLSRLPNLDRRTASAYVEESERILDRLGVVRVYEPSGSLTPAPASGPIPAQSR